jgi:hypothetical protein
VKPIKAIQPFVIRHTVLAKMATVTYQLNKFRQIALTSGLVKDAKRFMISYPINSSKDGKE